MSQIKNNLIASYAGKAYVGIINLALVPLYLRFMGVEAYGLVGFFATLQSLLVLFDLGMSTTVTRELARYSSLLGREQEIRDLTRTLEMIYWSIGGFIAIIVLLLSEIIGLY